METKILMLKTPHYIMTFPLYVRSTVRHNTASSKFTVFMLLYIRRAGSSMPVQPHEELCV